MSQRGTPHEQSEVPHPQSISNRPVQFRFKLAYSHSRLGPVAAQLC